MSNKSKQRRKDRRAAERASKPVSESARDNVSNSSTMPLPGKQNNICSKTKQESQPKEPREGEAQNQNAASFAIGKLLHKSMDSLLNSGWIQNLVIGVVLLCIVAVGALFVRSPKAIILFSASVLTLIIWFMAYLLVQVVSRVGELKPRIVIGVPHFPFETTNSIAGIQWKKEYIGVTLDITSRDAPAKDVDYTISLDRGVSTVGIFAIGQATTFSGFAAFPIMQTMPVQIIGTTNSGKEIVLGANTVADTGGCATWHVHCDRLIEGGTMRIVIAAIRFATEVGTPPPSGPIMRIEINGTYKSSDGTKTYPLRHDLMSMPPGVKPPPGAKLVPN